MNRQRHPGIRINIRKLVITGLSPRSLQLKPILNSHRVVPSHLTDLKRPLKKGDLPWNIALVCARCIHVLQFSFGLECPGVCCLYSWFLPKNCGFPRARLFFFWPSCSLYDLEEGVK